MQRSGSTTAAPREFRKGGPSLARENACPSFGRERSPPRAGRPASPGRAAVSPRRPGKVGARLRPLRLEEFDGVAGWILDEDLAAARPLDDLTTEARPLSGETLNGRVEIGNDNLESIPASRLGNATGLARAAYARLVEEQSQVILRQTGESRGKGKVDMKTEAERLELVRAELPIGPHPARGASRAAPGRGGRPRRRRCARRRSARRRLAVSRRCRRAPATPSRTSGCRGARYSCICSFAGGVGTAPPLDVSAMTSGPMMPPPQ